VFGLFKEVESLAVIDAFAKNPRYQGGGSSYIKPTKLDNIYEELAKVAGNTTTLTLTYSEAYTLESDEVNKSLIDEAVKAV
jgi:beta-glucosidase